MKNTNQFFITERPGRLYFRVALPGMVSMLAMSLYSVIEGAFIGQMLGEAAFAAVNIAMPFVMINFSLADMVGVGSSAPISIALGREDHQTANNFFTCSIFLIVAASVAMGLILAFASPALVAMLGAEGQLADLSVRYVRVYAILGPVTTLVFAMDNYLRISGFVRGSMLLNIFQSLLTMGLLFLFLGKLGMQVEGSALATCIAMTSCALIALIPFLRGKAVLKFVRPQLTIAMLRQVVACGAPTFLNNVAGRLASLVMNSALLRMGGQTAVAAYSVVMYASDILQPMLYGMSDAIAPAIGYNWGARRLDRVSALGKWAFGACGAVSIAGTGVMFFFARPLSKLFVAAGEPALLELSIHAMRLFCLAYLVRWFSFVVQSFFSAIEKPLPASLLSVCSAMVFPILFIWLLEPWGLDGLWLNLAATSLVLLFMALVLLRKEQRRMKRDIENAH